MPPSAADEQLLRSARFVFHGTVQKEKGGEVPGMPKVSAALVRLDRIVQGPDKLSAFEGRDVSVMLPKGERVSRGQRAIFYATGAYLGETLALEAIAVRPLPVTAAAGVAARAGQPQATLERRDLKNRVDSADMVVVGRVASVRLPPNVQAADRARRTAMAAGAGAAAAAAPPVKRRISEHDPDWREAVIDVDRVGKGAGTRKQVVVKFPASNDVRWFRAPKFTPGQQGVFILHRAGGAAPRTAAARAALAGPAPDEFTALDPSDVQPAELQDEIDTLVGGATPMRTMTATRARAAKARKASPAKATKTAGRASAGGAAPKRAGTTRGRSAKSTPRRRGR